MATRTEVSGLRRALLLLLAAAALAVGCAGTASEDPELARLLAAAAASEPAYEAEPTLALAYAQMDRGDPDAAIAAIDEAIARAGSECTSLAVATLHYARGQLRCELGEAASALPDLERALVDFRRAGDTAASDLRLACAMAVAAAFADVGELAQASIGLEALLDDPASANWPARWIALANLSDLRRRIGAHEGAVAAAREAVHALPTGAEIADRSFAEAGLARALDAAAATVGDEADHPLRREAEALLRAALTRLDGATEPEPTVAPLRSLLTQNLCSCLFHRGALDEAVPLSQAIVDALPDDTARPECVRILYGHASLLASTGDLTVARRYFARATDLAARQLAAAAATGSDRALFARHLEGKSLVSSVLSCRATFDADPQLDQNDLDAVLAARGLSEWRARRTHRLARAAVDDAWIRAEFAAAQGSAAPASGSPGEAARGRAAFDARQRQLLQRAPDAGPSELGDATRAAHLLPDDAVLLTTQTYERVPMARRGRTTARGEEHVAAFLLTRDGSVERFELGLVEPLRRAADRARNALRRGTEDVRGRAPGRPTDGEAATEPDLSAYLAPLLTAASARARILVVCPDDALAGVPFGALRLADGRRVLESHEVHYVDHPDQLGARVADGREGLLLLGAVDYGIDDGDFPPLPGSGRELDRCESLFAAHRPSARLLALRGHDAAFATFARAARTARFLHVSTHGRLRDRALWPHTADLRAPAGLAVADDPLAQLEIAFASGDDGRTSLVEASRFATLDLTGCELAVLACCDSNAGPRAFGDALSGLTAAARAAGARSLVGALWPIPDEASAAFLASFYEACWRDGASPAAALLRAQRNAIARGVPASCWAAFVHYGPIDEDH